MDSSGGSDTAIRLHTQVKEQKRRSSRLSMAVDTNRSNDISRIYIYIV